MKSWILLSLVAMCANVAKVIIVNKRLQSVDSRIIVLIARFSFAAVLVPACILLNGSLPLDAAFWMIVLATAVLSTIASVLFVDAIKNGRLAVVMPMQSAVPIFTVITLIFTYKEFPQLSSLVFMVISMGALAYTLYYSSLKKDSSAQAKTPKWAFYSLIAAAVFGFCAVLDKAAISRVASHGAIAFSAAWSVTSFFLILFECIRRKALKNINTVTNIGTLGFYCFSMILSFCAQQFAVQFSLDVEAAVAIIKSIVILYLCLLVLIDYFIFKDRVSGRVLAGALVAITAAVALMRSMM